ncbi:MAG: M1 family aminopeptidase [Tepidisphaeraceae bacterium]
MGRLCILAAFVGSVLCVAKSDLRADDLECASAVAHLRDRAFDSVTGRDTRNFAPDPQVDFQHIKLDLRMDDPASRSFTCEETITFKTPHRAIPSLNLNAVDLRIDSVSNLRGDPLDFRYDEKTLTVRFPKPLSPQTDAGVVIRYACAKPKLGMIFALPDDAYRHRPVSIHTQGEPEMNRYWFVSHDYPNTKQTTEIIATIPSKYSALSNGALVSKEDIGAGMSRWHYRLSKPHSSYLVSLVIGDFTVVKDTWRDTTVEYWVPASFEPNARRTFGKTPKMLELFSKLIGTDYPWDKYAQAVVYNFAFGGMENTSATTLVELTSIDERAAIDSDSEGLIAHELAHQWFGDLLTCKNWSHLWLNEGFATYMDWVWQEHEHGPEAYSHRAWTTMRGVAEGDDVNARGGVVWVFYDSPIDTLRRPLSNPYGKGASALHMLRRSLGDDLFWNCVAQFVKRNAFKPVETDDLRRIVDELSGRNYEPFFQQWLYRPGAPHFRAEYEWDEKSHEARVRLEQTQSITVDAPAFSGEVPVWLIDSDGGISRQTLNLRGRNSSMSAHCDREPAQIVIDPEGAVLAKWTIEVPVAMLIRQAQHGPTPVSRYNAIAALADKDRDDVRAALKAILLDEKLDHTYRCEAAAALGKMQQDSARDILVAALSESNPVREPRARRAAVAAHGQYRDSAVVRTLLRFASHDETYTIEAAASAALGKQRATDEIVRVLIENTKKPSYRDQIRTSAVAALAELADARGMAPAMQLSAYGMPFRSRSSGIEAVGKISRDMDKKDEARDFLVALLGDPQNRAIDSAIRALGDLGDERAIPALQAFVGGSALDYQRTAARESIDAISKRNGETAALRDLRTRVEKLEKARADAEKRPTTVPSTNPSP